MKIHRVNKATGSTKRPWRDPKCLKCRNVIAKGEPYQWLQGFHGPKKVICGTCVFSRSDMTNSKLASVYDAFDAAYRELDEADEGTDLDSIVNELAGTVREVGDEYRSAADEYFSGGGPNAEKADEVEQVVDELENIDVPDLTEFTEWYEAEATDDAAELTEEEWRAKWAEWIQEQISTFRGDIESADSL